MSKLWAGRFSKDTNAQVDAFHSSLPFDCRLWQQDIRGSIAHATMLGEQGIVPQGDVDIILAGLQGIYDDLNAGTLDFSAGGEDIHMWVETQLTQRIGAPGKALHTGRSRNDQVALDMRMYTKDHITALFDSLTALETLLLNQAEAHAQDVMPGYTHMQKAQPITLGHHLMAYFQMFARDMERLHWAYQHTDVCPLGSGALAGTTYPLNRKRVAALLDFAAISANSLDGVSDRDYLLECLSAHAMVMLHLSRFCEELILWSTHEFQFVEMDDGFSTGSSIMPQKKNPDVAELIRGKTGRVYGNLTALLTTMKSLPLAYNKDMQEDKEVFFDSCDTVLGCLEVFVGMLGSVQYKTARMRQGASGGFTNATDAADYLVTHGLPFRDAHDVIGKLVAHCIAQDKALLDLSLAELQVFSPLFGADVFEAIALETCVNLRNLPGGPAAEAVLESVTAGRAWLVKDYMQKK